MSELHVPVTAPFTPSGMASWIRQVGATLNRIINTATSAGGTAAWGGITGTLSAQTDLQAALDAKVPTSRTISTTAPLAGGGDLSANRTLSITGSALTRTDDTNVTLTLGGTPATALLAATSLTLGWTGTLAVGRGGTGSGTAAGARVNLLPSYTSNSLKVLRINAGETDVEWAAAGSLSNALTFNNGGAGAASGSTFDGSASVTVSYNTIGAAASASLDPLLAAFMGAP